MSEVGIYGFTTLIPVTINASLAQSQQTCKTGPADRSCSCRKG